MLHQHTHPPTHPHTHRLLLFPGPKCTVRASRPWSLQSQDLAPASYTDLESSFPSDSPPVFAPFLSAIMMLPTPWSCSCPWPYHSDIYHNVIVSVPTICGLLESRAWIWLHLLCGVGSQGLVHHGSQEVGDQLALMCPRQPRKSHIPGNSPVLGQPGLLVPLLV